MMKKITLPLLGALALLSLTGCTSNGIIPLDLPAAAATVDEPKPVETEEPKVLPSELSEGSVSHQVPVGAGDIIFDYWTSSEPASWEDGDTVAVNLALKTTGSGEMLYSATSVAAWTEEGELYHDEGDFTITPPFNYFTTLLVPVVGTGTEVTVRADLVIETYKDSGEFVKVSIADTLQVVYSESVNEE